jgi:MFS family permease
MSTDESEETSYEADPPPRRAGEVHRATAAAATYAALWTPALFQVLATAATWGFAHACFVLLPKYLSVELGVGAREIGRTMGAFGLASVPLSGVAGALVDRRPYRVAMAFAAAILAVSALGFATLDGFGPEIYLLRSLQALANALMVTAVGAAVVAIAPPNRHAQAIGLTGAAMLAMNAAAPMIAEPLAARAGWTPVFLMAAGMALVSIVFLRGMRAGPTDGDGLVEPARNLLGGDWRLATEYAVVSAISGVAFGTVMAFEQPFALTAGQTDVRGFLAAFALGALALRIGAGSLPDRIGRGRAALMALAAYAAGTAVLGLTPIRYLDALGLFLGLCHGLFFPALNVLMLSRVPRSHRGRALAVFTGAFHFGVAATAPLGRVAEQYGYTTVFGLAGGVTMLGVLILSRSRLLHAEPANVSTESFPLSVAPTRGH